jgi:hypothetical protein
MLPKQRLRKVKKELRREPAGEGGVSVTVDKIQRPRCCHQRPSRFRRGKNFGMVD